VGAYRWVELVAWISRLTRVTSGFPEFFCGSRANCSARDCPGASVGLSWLLDLNSRHHRIRTGFYMPAGAAILGETAERRKWDEGGSAKTVVWV